MDRGALDHALLEAHAKQDSAALVRLYALAANESETARDTDAACFFLTQAFVFALESGDARADELNRRLADHGRAPRLVF